MLNELLHPYSSSQITFGIHSSFSNLRLLIYPNSQSPIHTTLSSIREGYNSKLQDSARLCLRILCHKHTEKPLAASNLLEDPGHAHKWLVSKAKINARNQYFLVLQLQSFRDEYPSG
ncbi:predicted protein [Sclerotinia sclerotiorum 1980 UF-70]|uniref:Uncharacterized protein n=1 Tax=Sclerotinia sclerotiorum (strain ATCC 18683 / 1980 / Ss-1) TaxID=665079 RepID=A7ELU9_SCLS1|nr:predicted protein [Sclerotinia sclerotiorum 1980 UF-70]EDO03815.1 predicted protein [Sclerotinia sclerotiorum 1980 UF-70]